MRANAMENVLKLIINAEQAGDYVSLNTYIAKARILLSRNNDEAVIKELVNQEVKLE